MGQEHTDNYDRDCDSALGWIARLQSDEASQEDCEGFALWLAEDPARRRAFDSMLAMWDDLGSVRHLPGFDVSDHRPATAASRFPPQRTATSPRTLPLSRANSRFPRPTNDTG